LLPVSVIAVIAIVCVSQIVLANIRPKQLI